jgi:glycosyltransferase involved in cell wall biosynthesis
MVFSLRYVREIIRRSREVSILCFAGGPPIFQGIRMARIVIATDAWHPQVNGVVRTLDTTARLLRERGHIVDVIEPSRYAAMPVPFYPEIQVCLPRPGRIYDRLRRFKPDHVHISTEGPLGLIVRRYCRLRGWRFSTSYHTRFPEYLKQLVRVPLRWSYRFLKWFHNGSSCMMVATPSLEKELAGRGFTAPIRRWSRGVDLSLFHPRPKAAVPYERPVLLYVGRVSAEKGLDDFLSLKTPGTKVVVGDGPARAELEAKYPAAVFLGYRKGADLAAAYASADLFVFPSRTDTFGIVLIEALASGLPVAAYPVTGPIDIVTDERCGALDEDLGRAVERALSAGDPAACVEAGRRYTWENCTRQFLGNLEPVR